MHVPRRRVTKGSTIVLGPCGLDRLSTAISLPILIGLAAWMGSLAWHLLAARNPGGLLLLLFGLAAVGFAVRAFRARLAGTIEIDPGRKAILSDTDPVSFERVSGILVEEGPPTAVIIELSDRGDLSDRRTMPLTRGNDLREAVHLARHLAALMGTGARRGESELPPIDPKAPFHPQDEADSIGEPPKLLAAAILISVTITLCGAVGFLSGFFSALGLGASFPNIEFPNGAASGIAVAKDGTVYIGSRGYRRIQAYDKDGTFLRAWFVPAGKGPWFLAFSKDDHLLLAISEGPDTPDYALEDGQLLSLQTTNKLKAATRWGTRSFQAAGHWYSLRPIPFLVRRDGKPFIRQNLFYTLFMSPLPAWLMMVLGALMGFAIGRKKGTSC